MRRQRQLLSGFFLASVLGIFSSTGSAQSLAPTYGHPSVPFQVGNGVLPMKAKIFGTGSTCASGDLVIGFPDGFVYEGSATAVIYVSGIPGAPITLTPTSVSASSVTLPLAGIPGAGDSMIVTYNVSAGCDVIGSESGAVTYNLSTPGCTLTSSSASTAILNADNAQMNILSVTNSAVTNTVGYTYNRVITIQNAGLGYVDTVYLDNLSGAGFEVSSAAASSGTLTITTTVVGSDTLYRYRIVNPTADGHFNEDEIITITETVTIVGCSALSSSYTAWYGPNVEPCVATQGNFTAGATINNALQPVLTIVPNVANVNTCIGESASHTMKIVNTGTSVMKDLKLNMFSSHYTSSTFVTTSPSYEQAGFNPTNFYYKIGEAGTPTLITMDSTKTFSSPMPSMTAGGYVGNVFFTIAETLQPNDTLIVTFDEHMPITPNCSGVNKFLPGIRLNYKFTNGCGVQTQNNNGNIVKAYRYMLGGSSGIANTPSDMWMGETYDISFEQIGAALSYSTLLFDFPANAEYIFEITFPSRSTFSGSVSDLLITRSTGVALSAPSTFTYDPLTNKLTIKYLLGTPGIGSTTFQNASIYLSNISTDCSKSGTENSFGISIGYKIPGCDNVYMPVCKEYPTVVHCGDCGDRGGITPRSASVRRTNYGLPDNDNDGYPDAGGTLDFDNMSTNTVMHGDTLEFKYSGVVLYDVASLANFTTGHFESEFNGGVASYLSGLMPITAKVDIYNSAGTLIGTQTGLPFEKPTPTSSKVNYSIAYLSSFPTSYTRYNHGDSIVVTALYSVSQPISLLGNLNFLEYSSLNTLYVGNTMGPSIPNEERYFCDVLGGNFKWASLVLTHNGALLSVNAGCDTATITSDNHLGVGNHYYDGEIFKSEYRPLSLFSQIKVGIPEGYTFISAQATERISTGILNSTARTLSLMPESIVGDTLIFNIAALYDVHGGPWHVPDEGHVITYSVKLLPNCDKPSGTSPYFFIKYQEPSPNAHISEFPFSIPDYSVTAGNNVSYSKPNLISSSPEPVVTVNNPVAVWEVQLAQTLSGQTATNVWLAKQNGIGTVTITSVERLSGPGGTVVETMSPNAGGVYELGNYVGVGNKFYRITASYLNCVKDSVMISAGWSCDGYPDTEADAICKEEIKLSVIPQDANLQLTIIDQPTEAAIDVCDNLNYEIQVKNVGLGNANNPSVTVRLPGSGGVSYVPGTYEVLTSSGGGYVSVSDAEVVTSPTGVNITFNIPSAILASMPTLDTFRVKFALNTSGSCNWVSGGVLRFLSSGTKPCGTVANSTVVTSNRINLTGADLGGTTLYSINSTISDIDVVSAYSPSTYRFTLLNQGVDPTPSGQKISVEIPAPLQLNVGTVVNVKNHTAVPISVTVNSEGNTVYTWNLTSGVAPLDSVVFTADVFVSSGAVGIACGDEFVIRELVTQDFIATCSSNPAISCSSIQEITSNESLPFQVNRPMYELTGFTTSLSGTEIIGSVTVSNINGIHASQTAVLSLYKDENVNGIYDSGETLIGTEDIALTTASTQTHTYIVDPLVAGPYVPLVAVLSATYACDTPQTSIMTSLPVDLISFDAAAYGNVVKLDWITGFENNNKGFHIEMSIDGYNWKTIGFVKSQAINGNSNGQLTYSFIDENPKAVNLYRLRQEDNDGGIKYSPIRKVTFNGKNDGSVVIYPNPAHNEVSVKTNGIKDVILIDVSGRIIKVPVTIKGDLAVMDISSIPSGNYLISVENEGGLRTQHKLTVTK